MFKKFKELVNTDDKKRLFSNFISLLVLQGANYIIPLLIIPYLFAVLGSEKFGLIIFAQSLVATFVMFVNYGFNLSATKEIAIHRKNIEKVSEIYSTVITIITFFSFLAFFFFLIMIFSFSKFSNDRTLYVLTFGTIIESMLFPFWFFQGMEKMKYITIIYSSSKIIVALLIYIVIYDSSDYLLVPIFYFCGSITSGVTSMIIIFKYFKIKYCFPTLQQISCQLQDGWHLFLSNISINMYRNANILILGFLSAPVFVGYYALAEKVIKALQSLMGPISEALYPYIANSSSKQSVEKSITNLMKIGKYYFSILLTIVISIMVLAPFVAEILTNSYVKNIVLDMRILTVALFFGGFNYLMGILGLVSLGFQKYFSRSVLIAGILNVILCFAFSPLLKDTGAALSLSISEFILAIILFKKLFTLYQNKNVINE